MTHRAAWGRSATIEIRSLSSSMRVVSVAPIGRRDGVRREGAGGDGFALVGEAGLQLLDVGAVGMPLLGERLEVVGVYVEAVPFVGSGDRVEGRGALQGLGHGRSP